MNKRFLVLLFIFAAALAISGCSAPGSGNTADTDDISSSRQEASESHPTSSENENEESISASQSTDLEGGENDYIAEASNGVSAESGETDPVSGDAISTAEVLPSTAFTLDDAKKGFADSHPGAEITVAKLEDDIYYIEGWEGATLFKMKFAIGNGEIILDKTISTGRPS